MGEMSVPSPEPESAKASSSRPSASPDLGLVITRLLSHYVHGAPARHVFDALLPELLSLTHSDYGFIAEVWKDDVGQPYLKVFTLTNIAWDEATRALFDRQHEHGLEFRNLDSLFGATVRSGRPVIANDPANDPRAAGTPPGHPPMNAFLGVPLFQGAVLVGMVGLANRPGGYDRTVLSRLDPLFVAVGSIMGQVQSERERRRAEEALRRSEALYRTTFESAPLGIAQVALDGRYLEVNPRECQILGRSAQELRQLRFHDISHPDDLQTDLAQLDRLLAGEIDRYTMEKRFLRPDGSLVWTLLTVSLVRDANGQPQQLVSTLEDITERRELEQARVAAEAAERANRAKTEFLSRMSHELRTPLNAVLGFAQLLRMDARDPLSGNQLTQLRHIERAGQHLLAMINDVLDLSRIEVGAMPLTCEMMSLRPVVEEAIALLAPAAKEAQVELRCDAGPASARAWADPLRVRQALVNLLSNAVKYNHAGGRVNVTWQEEAHDVRITVSDTGRGLNADQLSHLFEPFNRLGAERTPTEGTGIGLVVTRRLVQLMNGELHVQSEPGVGSHFSITLPQAPQGAAPRA